MPPIEIQQQNPQQQPQNQQQKSVLKYLAIFFATFYSFHLKYPIYKGFNLFKFHLIPYKIYSALMQDVTGGSISLSMLIDFIVQRTYHDLTVLAEL